MANSIALAKKYLPLLDEVYAQSAKSAVLDAPADWVRETSQAGEVLIPSIALDGLADYSRGSGFVAGDADLTWASHTFDYDRGRQFVIDAQDNAETIDVSFSAVTGEFIRTKATPEVDAVRFAKIATNAGGSASADLTSATAVQAIDVGLEALAEAEVDMADVIIFVSPKVNTFLKQSSLITRQFAVQVGGMEVNREIEVLDGHPVIVVPQNRFYSEVTLLDGTTAGQEAGGYTKTAVTGKNINFLIVDPKASLGLVKTATPRIFSPEENQDADAWKFNYRLYHDVILPANKAKGLYAHLATA